MATWKPDLSLSAPLPKEQSSAAQHRRRPFSEDVTERAGLLLCGPGAAEILTTMVMH